MSRSIHGRILARLACYLLVVAAQCYTTQDLMNARCDVACAREGYGNGVFDQATKNCVCQDAYSVERLTHKKIKLPARRSGEHSQSSGQDLNYGPSGWQDPKLGE